MPRVFITENNLSKYVATGDKEIDYLLQLLRSVDHNWYVNEYYVSVPSWMFSSTKIKAYQIYYDSGSCQEVCLSHRIDIKDTRTAALAYLEGVVHAYTLSGLYNKV